MSTSQSLVAYLDAGSGSMIVSAIAGGFAAAAVALKMYWAKFLRVLHIRKDDDPAETPAVTPTEASEQEQPKVAETTPR
jgi:glycerol uptake facilitator-like aquaporin